MAPSRGKAAHRVAVSVRVRPPRTADAPVSVRVDARDGAVCVGDKAYRPATAVEGSDQAAAFDAIAAPLLDQLAAGYNATLLAYGQTGSGKTHTLFGPTGCLTEASLSEVAGADARASPRAWGLLPRLALALLAERRGSLHASAIEVYQEVAYDLLADRAPLTVGARSAGRKVGGGPAVFAHTTQAGEAHHGAHPPGCRCGACWKAKQAELEAKLARRDAAAASTTGSGRGGAAAAAAAAAPLDDFATVGETLVPLRDALDVARLARTVEVTRTAASHNLNARSSRSHCLVRVHVRAAADGRAAARGLVRHTTLLVVDLAGSERILKSGAEGAARVQATAINGSLTALGKCIRALGDGAPHVPFRDSTLTMLLRASLTGSARVAVVVQVAPDREHADESACSLEFGARMGALRAAATVAVGRDASDDLRRTRGALVAARTALEQMEADGLGETFGATVSEVRTFKQNRARFEQEDSAARAARAELVEARGSGASTRELAAIEARAESAEAEAANYRDIVFRQKTIKGFYAPPKACAVSKAAEIKQLEMQVAQLEDVRSQVPGSSPGDTHDVT